MTRIARLAVAGVWLYQGLWSKVLAPNPRQASIVEAVPGVTAVRATMLLTAFGLTETALVGWWLTGRAPRFCAAAQTSLLAGMNLGGLLWGRRHITDPVGMLVNNAAFLSLVWIAASTKRPR